MKFSTRFKAILQWEHLQNGQNKSQGLGNVLKPHKDELKRLIHIAKL